jgi:hypothetical protein
MTALSAARHLTASTPGDISDRPDPRRTDSAPQLAGMAAPLEISQVFFRILGRGPLDASSSSRPSPARAQGGVALSRLSGRWGSATHSRSAYL